MADSPKFSFQFIDSKKFPSIDGKENKEHWLKWSMKGRIHAQCYSFDEMFQSYQKDSFALAFMQDPAVFRTLQVCSSTNNPTSLGLKATQVEAEQVPCSVLSMGLFDRLYDHPIVREGGNLHKCFDEFYEDMTISDELRKMLLQDESDYYDIYSDSEREEFLFRLFKHICLGGSVCQYEDTVQPYLDVTKALYKDLVSVQKDSGSGDLHITSIVFKITAKNDDDTIYPAETEHEQNFAYLIVDPFKRHVIALSHQFGAASYE